MIIISKRKQRKKKLKNWKQSRKLRKHQPIKETSLSKNKSNYNRKKENESRKKKQKIEQDIEELEEAIADLETETADPNTEQQHQQHLDLANQVEEKRAKVDSLMEVWTELQM